MKLSSASIRYSQFPKVLLSVIFLFFVGCVKRSDSEVVVYSALDKEFSEPILDQFEEETGIRVLAKYDQESNKTVGLANAIIGEQKRPRCDVFWNNEVMHSLRLRKLDLLQSYVRRNAADFPEQFYGVDGTWHGFAARARVLIVNTQRLPDRNHWPTSALNLADPKWKGNVGLARPLFGTTATHAAVLFGQLGSEAAESFFRQVSENAIIEGGNKRVAVNVAAGKYAFGLTDTDDAIIELEKGHPVAIVFPDQAEGQMGTLFIPNTLAIIVGGPNQDNAKRLVDFLLTAEIEEQLAQGPSAQLPLSRLSTLEHRLDVEDVRAMQVDFAAAADQWQEVSRLLEKIFPIGG